MSMPLAEALEQVELAPGSTYCCRVKGRWVEVRVLEGEPPRLAKPFTTSDERLDPRVELPSTTADGRCEVRRGLVLGFDVPTIPSE